MPIKASTITQADIKQVIRKQVKDDVRQLRRELVLQRININQVVGVGNMEDYISEWESEFANSTTAPGTSQQRRRKMKRITKTKKGSKL